MSIMRTNALRHSGPAEGFDRFGRRRVTVSFDEATFKQVRERAIKNGASLGGQVRNMVRKGLRYKRTGEAPPR